MPASRRVEPPSPAVSGRRAEAVGRAGVTSIAAAVGGCRRAVAPVADDDGGGDGGRSSTRRRSNSSNGAPGDGSTAAAAGVQGSTMAAVVADARRRRVGAACVVAVTSDAADATTALVTGRGAVRAPPCGATLVPAREVLLIIAAEPPFAAVNGRRSPRAEAGVAGVTAAAGRRCCAVSGRGPRRAGDPAVVEAEAMGVAGRPPRKLPVHEASAAVAAAAEAEPSGCANADEDPVRSSLGGAAGAGVAGAAAEMPM
jgi:hypothetical protein